MKDNICCNFLRTFIFVWIDKPLYRYEKRYAIISCEKRYLIDLELSLQTIVFDCVVATAAAKMMNEQNICSRTGKQLIRIDNTYKGTTINAYYLCTK